VKEVSKFLNLTEHTIRFYTDKGLVPSVQRDKNNNQLFDQESINWLIGVKYLKQCGMSVEGIKSYVDLCLEGNSTLQERYEIILKTKRDRSGSIRDSETKSKIYGREIITLSRYYQW
jgi:DNA-binding transcriptional MerR regulator